MADPNCGEVRFVEEPQPAEGKKEEVAIADRHKFGPTCLLNHNKEIFEEHYHSFPKKMIEDALADMGYCSLDLHPVPYDNPESEFSKMDWYRLIAQKQ